MIGKLSDHQSGIVYGGGEYAPTLSRRDFKDPVKVLVDDFIEYPKLKGTVEIREGDGVVVVRPHKARMTKMENCAFALTQDSRNGVCVRMEEKNVKVAGELGDSNVVQDKQVYDVEGVSPSVKSSQGSGSRDKILWPNGTNGEIEAKEGDCVKIYPDPSRENSGSNVREDNSNALNIYNGCGCGVVVKGGIPNLKEGEVRAFQTPGRAYKVQNGGRCKVDDNAFTVTQETDGIVKNDNGKLRIRYLTPRECLRLQAFPDDAIDRLEGVLSKSAMYKVAGNSIAVCCLKAIFKGIYVDKTFKKDRQSNLDSFF